MESNTVVQWCYACLNVSKSGVETGRRAALITCFATQTTVTKLPRDQGKDSRLFLCVPFPSKRTRSDDHRSTAASRPETQDSFFRSKDGFCADNKSREGECRQLQIFRLHVHFFFRQSFSSLSAPLRDMLWRVRVLSDIKRHAISRSRAKRGRSWRKQKNCRGKGWVSDIRGSIAPPSDRTERRGRVQRVRDLRRDRCTRPFPPGHAFAHGARCCTRHPRHPVPPDAPCK